MPPLVVSRNLWLNPARAYSREGGGEGSRNDAGRNSAYRGVWNSGGASHCTHVIRLTECPVLRPRNHRNSGSVSSVRSSSRGTLPRPTVNPFPDFRLSTIARGLQMDGRRMRTGKERWTTSIQVTFLPRLRVISLRPLHRLEQDALLTQNGLRPARGST